MKKIFTIALFLLAFGFSAHAQQQSNDKKVQFEKKAIADVEKIASVITLDDAVKEEFQKVLMMKYEVLANDSMGEPEKELVKKRFTNKLLEDLSENDIIKLKENPEIYSAIFE